MRYYIGPLVASNDPEDPGLEPPAGCLGCMPLPNTANYFIWADRSVVLGRPYVELSQSLDANPADPSLIRTALRSLLHLDEDPIGDNLGDLLFDICTRLAGPKPLMPCVNGDLCLALHGHSIVRSKKFEWDDPANTSIQDSIKRIYAATVNRVETGQAKEGLHRMMLHEWQRRFKVEDVSNFVPRGLPVPELIKPETALHETFDQSDSTTIGPVYTWTETTGNVQTLGNELARVTSGTNRGRAETDVSSDDHHSEITIVTLGISRTAGPCSRFNSAAEDFYCGISRRNSANTNRIRRCDAGTFTTIATLNETWTGPGIVVQMESDGSNQTMSVDGAVKVGPTSDATHSGFTRGGYHIVINSSDRLDDWKLTDLSGAPSYPLSGAFAGPMKGGLG